MKKILLAVYDAKTEVFGMPFPADTIAQGVRDFSDAVADEKTMFAKHPEDYSLFVIGEYSMNNAGIVSEPAPRQIVTALECANGKSM